MGVSALSIPTYLRFACGHEAMVSLPRISGENARDRERRIAEEKASATLRRCDFCPPRTAIAAAVIQRFSVVFRAETVVEARTLNEALDRAEALGAGDITGITRIA